MDFEGLLRRFAKYTLSAKRGWGFLLGRRKAMDAPSVISGTQDSAHRVTFRFVDTTHLPESETHYSLPSFSKDLTSGDETIVFGGGNYIV